MSGLGALMCSSAMAKVCELVCWVNIDLLGKSIAYSQLSDIEV